MRVFDRGIVSEETAEGVRLSRQMKEERITWREAREGVCMLRTNPEAETAEQLWAKYMQLTEAEASFRALLHQKEPRVKAHMRGASLGYALRVMPKHLLKCRPGSFRG
jgi:hypothetical protein